MWGFGFQWLLAQVVRVEGLGLFRNRGYLARAIHEVSGGMSVRTV